MAAAEAGQAEPGLPARITLPLVQELATEGLDADASRYRRALEADDFVGRGDMSRGGIGPGQRPRGPLLPRLDALRSGRPPTRQDNEPAH